MNKNKKPRPLSQQEVEALIGHPVDWDNGTSQN